MSEQIQYRVNFEAADGERLSIVASLSADDIDWCKRHIRDGSGPGVPNGPCERSFALREAEKQLTPDQVKKFVAERPFPNLERLLGNSTRH